MHSTGFALLCCVQIAWSFLPPVLVVIGFELLSFECRIVKLLYATNMKLARVLQSERGVLGMSVIVVHSTRRTYPSVKPVAIYYSMKQFLLWYSSMEAQRISVSDCSLVRSKVSTSHVAQCGRSSAKFWRSGCQVDFLWAKTTADQRDCHIFVRFCEALGTPQYSAVYTTHFLRRRRDSLESSRCFEAHGIVLDFATANADRNEAVARAPFSSHSSFVSALTYCLLASSFFKDKGTKRRRVLIRSAKALRRNRTFAQARNPPVYTFQEALRRTSTQLTTLAKCLCVCVCVRARVGTNRITHWMLPMMSGFRLGPWSIRT